MKLKLKSCLYHLIRYTDCILVLLVFWNVLVKSSHGPLCTYLSKLKHANVVSIYKGEHKTDPSNYLPISLLFVYDSIFAKTMYRRLMAYLQINGMFCSSQYGFREKHSTEHTLIDIVNQIQCHFDKGMPSCAVFIDLKKAFDAIDHCILPQKLYHYCIWGIINDWFLLTHWSRANNSNWFRGFY